MSIVSWQQQLVRWLWIVILSVTLGIGGWVALQPSVTPDPALSNPFPSGPALAEGHEGSFGG